MHIKLENTKALSVNKAWQGKRYKTPEYKDFEEELLYRLPNREVLSGWLRVEYIFYLSGSAFKLTDVDNLIKALQDVLQKAGIIKNDNKILRVEAEKRKADQDSIEINIEKYEK